MAEQSLGADSENSFAEKQDKQVVGENRFYDHVIEPTTKRAAICQSTSRKKDNKKEINNYNFEPVQNRVGFVKELRSQKS